MKNYQDAPAAICIPVLFDKVTDDTFLSACWERRPKRRDNIHVGDVKYIKKDFLLEWAEEEKKKLFEGEPTDVSAGINAGIDMLLAKISNL